MIDNTMYRSRSIGERRAKSHISIRVLIRAEPRAADCDIKLPVLRLSQDFSIDGSERIQPKLGTTVSTTIAASLKKACYAATHLAKTTAATSALQLVRGKKKYDRHEAWLARNSASLWWMLEGCEWTGGLSFAASLRRSAGSVANFCSPSFRPP